MGHASIRTWLYSIATNRSLDALRANARRPERLEPLNNPPTPSRMSEPIWLEPYPDSLIEGVADKAPGPDARYELREAIALAFVSGLQHLPPQQRAVLVLREVLGYHAAEAADILDTSEAAVNSLLRRARAKLEDRLPAGRRDRAPLPNSRREREVAGQFANAFEAGDIDTVVALLTDDAWLTMPPYPYQYQGGGAIGNFLRVGGARHEPLRLVPTRANGQPAFGCYLPCPQTGIARAYGLVVLTLAGRNIAEITFFADSSVFPQFGLPRSVPKQRD
jgi:RNA polymerase sigma-70 factor (ECF subfamily)